MEELIAEMGSAYLSAHCRLDGCLQHASYLSSWLEVLHRDKKALFIAAGKAQQATDYLLRTTGQAEEEIALSVDYKKVPELQGLKLDDYRGKGRFETRITVSQ